jgi:ABC-2 type transport system ATP-binding protein
VLFLDEPTVGLDPRIRAEPLDVIAGLRDRSETTILLTTHYLDEAERLCDRLAIMHEGTIVALDSPSKLRAELGDEIVELRVHGSGVIALDALRAGGLAGEDAFAIGATVTVPQHGRRGADTVRAIGASGLRTVSVATRETTLDDVYLRLTGGFLIEAA